MKKRYLIIGILVILFIINTILVLTNNTKYFDDTIYNFLINFRSKYFDLYFINVTKLGNTITVILLVLLTILLISKKDRNSLILVILSTVLTNNILKNIIRRARPQHLRLIKQGGYSYPSGHAMISIALYGYLIYTINRNINNKALKNSLIIVLTIIIISVGLSRIYVGVHYPSDILGGYLLAIIIELVIVEITNKKLGGYQNDKNDSN